MRYRTLAIAGAVGVITLGAVAGAQTVPLTTVVATGMSGAGGGYTFTTINAQFAYANGRVAFAADDSGPGHDQGLWTTTPGSAVYQLPIYDGQSATNNSSTVFGIGDFQVSGDGSIAFDTATLGWSVWTPANGIVQIAGSGQTPPGIGGSYSGIGLASINSSDNVAYEAGIESAGSGVWTNAWGNGTQLVAYTGQTAPSGLSYGSFDNKTILAGTTIFDSATLVSGVLGLPGLYQFTPNGTQTLLQKGSAIASMPGSTFTGLGIPTYGVNASGHLAIYVQMSTGDAIMLDTGSGLQPVATTGQTAPVLGGKFKGFSNPVINDSDTVAYVANANGQALFLQGSGGSPQFLVSIGESAPGVPGGLTYASFGNMAISDTNVVGFIATLQSANNLDNPYALCMVGSDGIVQVVAYTGETMSIGPGLGTGTISQIEFANNGDEPQAMDGDSLVYEVEFTNGDYGLYTATVPEPVGMSLIIGTVAFAAMRRRRSC